MLEELYEVVYDYRLMQICEQTIGRVKRTLDSY